MDISEDNSAVNTSQFSAFPKDFFREDTEYDMTYTGGENPWDFWLAEVERLKSFERWQTTITDKVHSNELKKMEMAKSGDLAVILLPSGLAARVKILTEASRDYFGAYNVSVLDVDTGKMMTIYVEDLYFLDDELSKKKPFSVNCCLNLDHRVDNYKFLQNANKGPLKVVFKRVTLSTPPKYVVDIYIKGKQCHINLVDILNTNSTTQRTNVTMDKRNEDVNEAISFRYQSCKLGNKSKISDETEIITDIQVPHVDSLSKFYVWDSLDSIKELKSLLIELKSFYKSTAVKVPDVFINSLSSGIACAVFDIKESNWCRGEVLHHSKTSDFKGLIQKHYEVLLVDFGNIIEFPVSLIKPLDSKFFKYPVFAKRCHLFGLKPAPDLTSPDGLDYSKDVIQIFELFLDSGNLTLIEASTRLDDPPNSIPVILERQYKGKDYVINLELLTQKLVSSPVFDIGACNKILENADKGKIQHFSTCIKPQNGGERTLISIEPSQRYSPEGEHTSISFKPSQLYSPEGEHTSISIEPSQLYSPEGEHTSISIEPSQRYSPEGEHTPISIEPSQRYSPEPVFEDWNPMAEDYNQSDITYQNVINDDASALIGYQAKDEERICKFFAQSGHCFKGAACRKEHNYIRPDGWTTDCQLVYGNTFSYLALPESGSVVKLQVMIVTDICKFYAVLVDAWNYKETSVEYLPNEKWEDETLDNLIDLINSKKNVAQLQRLVMPPGVGEIVLCKMPSVNLYYRAQVLDTNLEENKFLVLFVDIGMTDWIDVKNMRQIEKNYLHLPFQAIDCELAYCGAPENIDGLRRMEIMRKLSSLISLKTLTAHVVMSFTPTNKMVVEIFDKSGVSVGEKLIVEGYLTEVPAIYDDDCEFIPG